MDEPREAALPLQDEERTEAAREARASASLSTADLAGRGAPAPEQARPGPTQAMEGQLAPRPVGAATTTIEHIGSQEPAESPAGAAPPQPRPQDAEPATTPLFSTEEGQGFQSRWQEIQAGFVDEPRQAVERADSLVAEVMKQLAEGFAEERSKLEAQWDRGEATDTEDLRQALRRYRSFFDRLLSM